MSRAGWTPWVLWYQVHKYLGLTALTFLILASVTGIALVYDKALDALFNPALFVAPHSHSIVEPALLVAGFQADNPALTVTAMPVRVPAGHSVLLTVARAAGEPQAPRLAYDQVFLDPSDGSIIGTRLNGPGHGKPHWIQNVYTFHTALFAGRWGARLMGSIGLVWLVETLVGLYLTLPRRRPFFAKWKSAWVVGWRHPWPRVMRDLHRATGLWALPFMVSLAYSSFGIGLYDEALLPIVNAISPPRPSLFDRPPVFPELHTPTLGFDRAIRIAVIRARHDGLAWPAAVATYLPERALYGVMFSRSGVEEYSGLGPVTYYLDDRSGDPRLVDDVYVDTAGAKVLRATYPIHSGQVGGNVTRWLVILMGLLLLETAITGLLVWWRKRRKARPSGGVEVVGPV